MPSLVTETPQPGQGPPSSNGLSTGAYIGIGVGCGIGALLLIVLVVLIFCLGKRKGMQAVASPAARPKTRRSELGTDGGISPTAEMEAGVTDMGCAAGVADMEYDVRVTDLRYGASWKAVELPGDKTWHQHSYSQ